MCTCHEKLFDFMEFSGIEQAIIGFEVGPDFNKKWTEDEQSRKVTLKQPLIIARSNIMK
jgi:hypothetical protein